MVGAHYIPSARPGRGVYSWEHSANRVQRARNGARDAEVPWDRFCTYSSSCSAKTPLCSFAAPPCACSASSASSARSATTTQSSWASHHCIPQPEADKPVGGTWNEVVDGDPTRSASIHAAASFVVVISYTPHTLGLLTHLVLLPAIIDNGISTIYITLWIRSVGGLEGGEGKEKVLYFLVGWWGWVWGVGMTPERKGISGKSTSAWTPAARSGSCFNGADLGLNCNKKEFKASFGWPDPTPFFLCVFFLQCWGMAQIEWEWELGMYPPSGQSAHRDGGMGNPWSRRGWNRDKCGGGLSKVGGVATGRRGGRLGLRRKRRTRRCSLFQLVPKYLDPSAYRDGRAGRDTRDNEDTRAQSSPSPPARISTPVPTKQRTTTTATPASPAAAKHLTPMALDGRAQSSRDIIDGTSESGAGGVAHACGGGGLCGEGEQSWAYVQFVLVSFSTHYSLVTFGCGVRVRFRRGAMRCDVWVKWLWDDDAVGGWDSEAGSEDSILVGRGPFGFIRVRNGVGWFEPCRPALVRFNFLLLTLLKCGCVRAWSKQVWRHAHACCLDEEAGSVTATRNLWGTVGGPFGCLFCSVGCCGLLDRVRRWRRVLDDEQVGKVDESLDPWSADGPVWLRPTDRSFGYLLPVPGHASNNRVPGYDSCHGVGVHGIAAVRRFPDPERVPDSFHVSSRHTVLSISDSFIVVQAVFSP
ncbi:hypothetical protein DFP72DRAFT_1052312 [Ephemerocybe angulata]|uniref:Uncharacterized protein n=1 Tax=Ephemerocybe angulata TaxID=980116 RepID=A0A8H6HD66_9AGAR|nr:hypothetical protein DFP72DRAFT_1052312 [Tulosesus angulatus]